MNTVKVGVIHRMRRHADVPTQPTHGRRSVPDARFSAPRAGTVNQSTAELPAHCAPACAATVYEVLDELIELSLCRYGRRIEHVLRADRASVDALRARTRTAATSRF